MMSCKARNAHFHLNCRTGGTNGDIYYSAIVNDDFLYTSPTSNPHSSPASNQYSSTNTANSRQHIQHNSMRGLYIDTNAYPANSSPTSQHHLKVASQLEQVTGSNLSIKRAISPLALPVNYDGSGDENKPLLMRSPLLLTDNSEQNSCDSDDPSDNRKKLSALQRYRCKVRSDYHSSLSLDQPVRSGSEPSECHGVHFSIKGISGTMLNRYRLKGDLLDLKYRCRLS